jgi:hypothetical protein
MDTFRSGLCCLSDGRDQGVLTDAPFEVGWQQRRIM